GRTKTNIFVQRTSAAFLQGLKDAPARGIGNGMENSVDVPLELAHDEIQIDSKSTIVNMQCRIFALSKTLSQKFEAGSLKSEVQRPRSSTCSSTVKIAKNRNACANRKAACLRANL